jgi:hypothetical protein
MRFTRFHAMRGTRVHGRAGLKAEVDHGRDGDVAATELQYRFNWKGGDRRQKMWIPLA